MSLRIESKQRARALQLLYALEIQGELTATANASRGLARLTGPEPRLFDSAVDLVEGTLAERGIIDQLAQAAADNWRMERLGIVERNILRLAIHELRSSDLSAAVVINEAVWLAQRFADPRAPAFINGVLDRVARDLGRLPAVPA